MAQHPPVLWHAYANRWDIESEQPPPPTHEAQPFLVATISVPSVKPPSSVLAALSGWEWTIDGGLQGVSVLSAGFLFENLGRVYELIYSDICTSSNIGGGTGLHYAMQRSGSRSDRDRDTASLGTSVFSWPFTYLTDTGGTDNLVVYVQNQSSTLTWTVQSARVIIREVLLTP